VSGVQWSAHRRWLEPEFDVITPDLPSHGTRAAEPFTMDAAVAAVAEAVDEAAPDQPVVLVGHSLGGYVAMTYAAAYPRRLAGLVTIGAAPQAGAAAYTLLRERHRRRGERITAINDRMLRRCGA
jgi:pimeloyl-ACP methyl ester carboxylesterase